MAPADAGAICWENLLLQGLFHGNGDRNSHTDHGVVACAQEAHHFHVGGDGGGTGELGIAVHTAHKLRVNGNGSN